jgi:signal transduction histidine kinase
MLTVGLVAGAVLGGIAAWWLALGRRRGGVGAGDGAGGGSAGGPGDHASHVAAMTAGLAHEIKNPLSTIGMNAQLLDEAIGDLEPRAAGGDEQELARIRRRIGTLTRETERLRGILEDFLEFAGEMRLHLTAADANELVEELGDFFHPEAEKAGVRLRVEPWREPVPLVADVPHLKQALLNLMINATQAMGMDRPDGSAADGNAGGGELILRVTEGRRAGNREAQIHVIDTGPGLDGAQRARVFEPYYTTKGGGTGLGLPTARRIVDAHGGRLLLETEVGRGSDFAVVLPIGEETG